MNGRHVRGFVRVPYRTRLTGQLALNAWSLLRDIPGGGFSVLNMMLGKWSLWMITTVADAMNSLSRAWPMIVDECRNVLGGELHYQAVVYHCLRTAGVPGDQIGMNVKQWIANPVTPLFQSRDLRKNENFRGGFEPIPDIVLFKHDISADWRRRNYIATLQHMLLAIEVKVSERAGVRLGPGEIARDIDKLAAHRDEVRHRHSEMHPVMMVIDTAPLVAERMTAAGVNLARAAAMRQGVSFLYISGDEVVVALADCFHGEEGAFAVSDGM